VDGNEIRQILQNYQTPLYCFDIDELKRRVQYLRDSLPAKVKLAYAAKANTFIVKEIEPMIDYYEICSPGEFEVCLDLDVDLSKVVLSGVYKAEEDIQSYLDRKIQIGKYTVESLSQLELLDRLSKKYKQSMDVILRLTSVNQFGMDADTIFGIVRNQDHYSYLNIVGIQYFSGTQKHSIKVLQKELNRNDLKHHHGLE
jgi:diaminopimelate decarboxylase